MNRIHEQLTAQFYLWELRGRGWQAFDEPVALEPPFRPFLGHWLPRAAIADDVRRESLASGMLGKLRQTLSPAEPEESAEDEDEPAAELWSRDDAVEFQITLPKERKCPRERMESLFLMLSGCEEPLAFEIMATGAEVVFQIASGRQDASLVRRQISAHFPDLVIHETEHRLAEAWGGTGSSFAVAEFGLAREFMLPLAGAKTDIFLGLVAAMSALEAEEFALYQVLFEPVRNPWAESALAAVTDGGGGSFFSNRPDLLPEARAKVQRPLYSVAARIVTSAGDGERAWSILGPLVTAMSGLAKPGGNYLVPLSGSDITPAMQEEDMLRRHTHRLGMLLNLDELQGLVHFPEEAVRSARLRVDTGRTREVPNPAAEGGLFLGWNEHAGMRSAVTLSLEQRVRHMHVIGGTGTGKTNFLFNLIQQDIEAGNGIGVLDPHGDLVDRILGAIPEHRINDVVLLDASDETHSVGFNILTAKADFEKTLLASDLVSVFQRLSTSWGDQMGIVLRNAILAFLESSEGGTLADLQRFLLEQDFRARFLATVEDPDVVYYWKKGFPLLSGTKSIGPVLTRLQTFLSPKPIRYMVSQRENRLDFADITDSGKILLAKLPQGLIGAENSFLLGSLIVSKLQQTAMARQRVAESQRRLFTLYVDEFQNFITPSMAEILSGTRKYRLAMVLAHQELEHLNRNDAVGSAVRANAGTRVVFRVGDADARELARGFAHFEADALQSLDKGQAIVRVERSDHDFNLSVPLSPPSDEALAQVRRDQVVAASRRRHARSRAEIVVEEKERREAQETVPPRKAPATPQMVQAEQPKDAAAPEPEPTPMTAKEALLPASQMPAQPDAATSSPPLAESASSYEPTAVREDVQSLGRGGELHQAAQIELKQIAEAHGFRAIIEKQLPGSQGTVDLYLERGATVIGCEVSVTNTLDFELRNVLKCLRAGIPMVAVVALEEEKLAKLQAGIRNGLAVEQAERVRFFLKADFVSFLQSVLAEQPGPTGEKKKHKGWTVKTTTVDISEEEARAREAGIAEALAESLRTKPGRKKK